MRKIYACTIVIALIPWLALGPEAASAWEFSMKGTYNYEYEGYTQLGDRGFFGRYDIDNSGAPINGGFSSVNFWGGQQIGAFASGSDMALQTLYMPIDLQLKINKAIKVQAQHWIGAWDGDTAQRIRSEYANFTIPGVKQSFSPSYWNILWLTARTPIGTIAVGKRPLTFGTGMIFNGTDSTSTESTLLTVPFGPFAIGALFYPWRQGSAYYELADKNAVRNRHVALWLKYTAGYVEFGARNYNVQSHQGAESRIEVPAIKQTRNTLDQYDNFGCAYIKYNDGRFFFNGEVDWFDRVNRWQGQRSDYIEHWRYMTELGAYLGPAKLSLIWAWMSGPDRRNGIMIDRQGGLLSRGLTNTGVFRPYSLVMVYNYGTGVTLGANSSFARNGYLVDANAYGVRLDYAIATNLNVFGSFFYADRVSHGYGWGYLRPGFDAGAPGPVLQGIDAEPRAGAPSIPDRNLGYEFDWGVDWQILEGLTISSSFGYWQPGRWFHFACIDKSVTGWETPNAGNNWGTNPDRTIDPVFGWQLVVAGEF